MQGINSGTTDAYPGIDLGRAYQYLLRLRDTDLTQRLRSSDLMHAVGYSQRGGRVSRVLGAFRQFGFTNFDGTFYTLTDLGKGLLSTGTEISADKAYALQAARSPKLYEAIYTKTNGIQELTLSDELIGIMVNYGIKRSDMEGILKNYIETLRFVDHGVTFELQGPTSRQEGNKAQSKISENMIRVDFGDHLIMEVPRDLILKASLHDLSQNGPSSRVRLIPDEK